LADSDPSRKADFTKVPTRLSNSFEDFCRVCEALSGEKSKKKRAEIVANYLRSLPLDDVKVAARFLLGRALPVRKRINSC